MTVARGLMLLGGISAAVLMLILNAPARKKIQLLEEADDLEKQLAQALATNDTVAISVITERLREVRESISRYN
jgi:DNA-binding protein H-NS